MLDDPVAEAAPLAYRLAQAHCRTDAATGEGCAWYHGARLYIRALGIGQCSIPDSHHAFFARAFAEFAGEEGFTSILVSGSADYAMPRLIVEAYAEAHRVPQLEVVDICATPLRLMAWYAERHHLAMAFHHSDILAHAADRPADIIATHHLFNYFPRETRSALVTKWHALLRPGGKLVVVSRYRGTDRVPQSARRAERAAFTEVMVEAARAQAPSLGIASDTLVAMIRAYRAQIRAHCLDSEDELRQLLEAGGFAVERYDFLAQRRGASAGKLAGQETADAVGVVARKL